MTEDKTQPPEDRAADRAVADELKGVPEEMLDNGRDSEGEDEIAKLRDELDAARQDVLYARAETQNVRRRLEKDIADTRNYAATGFARDILSVADNLSRALSSIPADLREDEKMKNLVAGIEATSREIEKVFSAHGITRIAAMGLPLDPNQHQAMIELPSDEAEPGTVVQEMQAGYMIKDRLLRPAMVAVAKKPD
ncbi:protein GrpE [Novosphingobium endophyticum]|uniref:Protein GrpE n=1 Tax=Novosphingobium endophyticum TaxID=1955250 RepID=A0A916TRW1_9SPHN|nr:nucleotide exchange factor GrpE [Novosphingobium endophyticum]GGB98068.1 protein GrpE [Novosphingobium endophyticum]